mgnify:CR=1 FL=1
MKKTILIVSIFVIILLAASYVATASENKKIKEPLDKITFIHYKDGTVKEFGKAARDPICYKLLGVKWNNLPVSYVINPSNPQGLSEDFVTTAIFTSAETWDNSVSKELFNNIYNINYFAISGIQDFKNTIAFGDYSDSNVIAVTSIWYTRRTKQIVEFDMLFDTDFVWGDVDVNSGVMDLQNIATHELGHGVGLGDIYSTVCSQVTMYGYSDYGETIKRDLTLQDITGLQKIYGF